MLISHLEVWIKDFNNYKPDNAKSDIIVINKKDKFMLTLNLPESDYCKVFDGDFFMMFFNKEKNLC